MGPGSQQETSRRRHLKFVEQHQVWGSRLYSLQVSKHGECRGEWVLPLMSIALTGAHAWRRADLASAGRASIALLRLLSGADHRTKEQANRSQGSEEDTQIRPRYVALARM